MRKSLFLVLAVALITLVSCNKEADTAKFVGIYGGTYESVVTTNIDGDINTENAEGEITGIVTITTTEVENEILITSSTMDAHLVNTFTAKVDGNKLIIDETTKDATFGEFTIPITYNGNGEIDGNNLNINILMNSSESIEIGGEVYTSAYDIDMKWFLVKNE